MDYYSVLHSAIEALDPNEPATRAAIYNRARKIITDKAADSHIANTNLSNELMSLEKAIQRIEKEFLKKEAAELEAQERTTRFLRRDSGWPWKTAALASIAVAFVAAAGIGLFYWAQSKPKTVQNIADSGSRARTTEAPLSEPDLGSDSRPYTLRRQLVYYRTTYPPGALVISKSQKFLYLVRPNVTAMRYSIGISRRCADSAGLYQVSDKEEFPGWDGAAPAGQVDLITRNANPLGARALYLERDERRIHGVSKSVAPGSSLACFQLINEDIIDLFDRVAVGTRVVATN